MSRIYACGNTCFLRRKFDRNVKKVVWFRRKRSDGNTSKRYVSANGNMSLPSCFRNGFTGLRMFPLTDSWNFVVHGQEATLNIQKQSRTCVKYGRIEGVTGRYLRCSQCHASWYCSKLCQQEHWGDHKILCEAVREMETLSQSSTKGEEEFKMSFPAHLTPR